MKIVHDDAPCGARFATAVLAALDEPTAAFRAFAGLDDGPHPPHFSETSMALGDRVAAQRLTHYFDVRNGAARAAARRYFASAAAGVGIVCPTALDDALDGPLADATSCVQFIVGIDAGLAPADGDPGRALRLKLYALFDAPSAPLVDVVARVAGRPLPTGLDPAEPFMVGLDIGVDGPSDLKVYLRLPVDRLPRVVRPTGAHAPLLRDVEEAVVAISCAHPARRVLHLRSGRVANQLTHLEARARTIPVYAQALAHVRRVEALLPPARLLPYVVGLPWVEGGLRDLPANLYLHPTTDARALR